MNFYSGPIDGDLGTNSWLGIEKVVSTRIAHGEKWPTKRRLTAVEQLIMRDAGIDVGDVDGLIGPQTQYALEQWQNKLRDIPSIRPTTDPQVATDPIKKWPYQSECPNFYGSTGANQTRLVPPYQFYLYDSRQKVSSISLHTKVASSVERVLKKVLVEYGEEEINILHLNRYFGSLNVRKMRGGSAWSMHSWGIAIDFDANRNQLRWGSDRAAFAKSDYNKWWAAWEAEGWVSLGRERNYDYMHVQAARI
jgi:hypothetical protein